MRDGDGWTECTLGHHHWGRYGAAGLLAVTEGTPYVLIGVDQNTVHPFPCHRAPITTGCD